VVEHVWAVMTLIKNTLGENLRVMNHEDTADVDLQEAIVVGHLVMVVIHVIDLQVREILEDEMNIAIEVGEMVIETEIEIGIVTVIETEETETEIGGEREAATEIESVVVTESEMVIDLDLLLECSFRCHSSPQL